MWRAIFISIGVIFIVFGLEFLVVEKAIFAKSTVDPSQNSFQIQDPSEKTFLERFENKSNRNPNDFEPDDWVPWGLLSAGVVIVLYSLTIKRENDGGGGEDD